MSDMGTRIGDINLSEVWMMSALVRIARIDGLGPLLDMTVDDAWRMLAEVLNERQVKVFTLRFGIANGYSLNLVDTGREIGVTGERVRQIEAAGLGRLRNWVGSGMAAKWQRETKGGTAG